MTYAHQTVMRDEVMRALCPRAGGVYVDVTLGGGGHAEAILSAASDIRLIGLDRDEAAIEASKKRLARYIEEKRLAVIHAAFGRVGDLLAGRKLDGVVADLGVSSPQMDDASRGMSLRREASSALLDMRMDRSQGETARALVDRLSEEELANVIFELGEERRSRKIARSIKHAADKGKLETTGDLRHAVYAAVGGDKQGGIDPATRTFQALRIAVNDELGELDRLLLALPSLIVPEGVAVIISFHSLEDGRVKRAFKGEAWEPLTKKPIEPSEEEVAKNPRARSAKLRAARRNLQRETHAQNGAARYAERKARKARGR